ncbi:hypothetical protein MASR2M18_02160 [Ignavibacteria bacterium]|jgi:DNA polymerase elongation subunit (family B)|nr:ribonuclease H-like domain-containing protein [Bacteroidota bacterium]MCZ2132670.1 ribonuclease H-like domain-containing protein [Bacteroidota bacterium]
MTNQRYLVFDIETNGLPFDSFDEGRQEYLLRGASDDAERSKRVREMSLSPLTAEIVCIGYMMIRGTENGWDQEKLGVFALDASVEQGNIREDLPDGGRLIRCGEQQMLIYFWDMLRKFPDAWLVSFNGRNFDAPFLMLRSAALGLRPSRNLMHGTKFNYPQHTDLLDELTFFVPQSAGATRRYNFDFFAKSFGITSPKGEGIDGSKVGEFYAAGDIVSIASYCLRDVHATWELFMKWKEFLDFR